MRLLLTAGHRHLHTALLTWSDVSAELKSCYEPCIQDMDSDLRDEPLRFEAGAERIIELVTASRDL